MEKAEIVKFLNNKTRWIEDSWGNFKNESSDGKVYRVKIQANSVRLEVKCNVEASQYSPASSFWVKLDGAYFKDIKISEKSGGLVIGRKIIKAVQ
jgi:competence transcription factor ComK